MEIGVVPHVLRDAINERLTGAYQKYPAAEADRERHYKLLLAHFDEHGEIPEFSLIPPGGQ